MGIGSIGGGTVLFQERCHTQAWRFGGEALNALLHGGFPFKIFCGYRFGVGVTPSYLNKNVPRIPSCIYAEITCRSFFKEGNCNFKVSIRNEQANMFDPKM